MLPHLVAGPVSLADSHSAVLIACYSAHPLVPQLAQYYAADQAAAREKPVLGIFEASVVAALSLLHHSSEKFGVITTSAAWASPLELGVEEIIGWDSSPHPGSAAVPLSSRFAGVETTGLQPIELHTRPAVEVRQAVKDAVGRLIDRARGQNGTGELRAICLGCAGMAGMEETVREKCVEMLGQRGGGRVHIVDGVKAGYLLLEGMLRMQS